MVAAALVVIAQLAAVARVPLDTTQAVAFHALVIPDTVYVGQQATYQVGVFIDDDLRLRLRRNPEFVPPDPQGMLAYELASPSQGPATRRIGRHSYEIHVFERALFPLAPGRYEVPSAELAYSLPLSLSFFSREESHTLMAESLAVVARAPPTIGRPPDYLGAVGDLTVTTRLDSVAARVGDPLRLTMVVAGRANVKLLPRPTVALGWGSLVAGQERVTLDTSSEVVRGTKEFDWVVTPRDSGRVALPSVRYPYFNPYTERYEIALTAPASFHVGPGELAQGDTARSEAPPPLSLRLSYRGPASPPLYDGPLFVALVLGAPAPALLLSVRRRTARRKPRLVGAASTLRALSRERRPVDAMAVRRLFVAALSERFSLPADAFTHRGTLAHALRREGVTGPASDSTEGMLAALDRAAFGGGATVPNDVCARAFAIYAVADIQGRRPRKSSDARGPQASSTAVTGAILVMGGIGGAAWGGALGSRSGFDAPREFARAVTAYAARDYAHAARGFAAVATWTPTAADAWVNAGTAAWALGDSADAVVGWQRAGRLEPLARDVRERLALVRAPQDGPIARLPRLPAPWAANFALAFWLLAWSTGAWQLTRGHSLVSPAVGISLLCTAAGGWLAVRTAEEAAARHLAVVGPGAALYAAPALAAERVARLDAGDVASTVDTRGVWTRVRLDGDRDGWIETFRLTSLAR